MGTVYAQAIRKEIPPSVANSMNMAGDKGIGTRTSKARISTITAAKVGVSVGGAFKKAGAIAATVTPEVRKAAKRKGVGISARNLHWFALGTADRWTGVVRVRQRGKTVGHTLNGKRIRFTGKISVQKWGGFVQRGAASAEQAAISAARQKLAERIADEQLAAIKGTR
jgi:hypothetical protein